MGVPEDRQDVVRAIWEEGMRLNDVCRPRTVLNGPIDRTRNISRLEELPESIWEEVEEPKPGYNYRTEVSVGGICMAALLDTGAKRSS